MLPVLSVAAAQEASPARKCADAASGTEIEVCLRLAAEHPEAVNELTAALVAWVDRAEGPDRDLLDALVLLQSGDAITACARLAATGDPRAEAILENTVLTHREPETRIAAAFALATFPAALPSLFRWVEDRELPLEVRVGVVEALARVDAPDVPEHLYDLLRRPGIPPAVRQALVRVLGRRWPEALPDTLPPQQDGTPWLATGSSLSLGYAMATAGWFGRGQLWTMGALTGSTAGATAGWIYGKAWPVEAGDAALVATAGALGTTSGYLLGLGRGDDLDAAFLYGLGGEATGLGLGLLATGLHPGTGEDAAEATTLAVLVGGASAVGALARGGDARGAATAAGTGLAVGTVFGHVAGPGFSPRRDGGLVLAGGALGAAGGALVPADRPAYASLAGALGGSALGGVVGAWGDPPPDLFWGGLTGAGMGGALGYGAGLAAGTEPTVRAGLGIGVGTLGLVTGTTFALLDPDPIDDRDAVLTVASAAWAGWNAAAIARLTEVAPDRTRGAALLSAAAAGTVVTALNVPLDVPVPEALCASSLGIWGGYVGYQAGDLAGLDPVAVALPTSDAGLLAGAILVSPAVGVPPLVLGVADAGGVFGGATGALLGGLATADRDVITTASLVGAGIGGAVGMGVGSVWHHSQTRRDVVLHAPHLPPVALGPGPGTFGVALAVGPW